MARVPGLRVGQDSGDDQAFDPEFSDFTPNAPADPFAGDGAGDSYSDDPSNSFDVDTNSADLGNSVMQGELSAILSQLQQQAANIATLQANYQDDPSQGGGYGGSYDGGGGYQGDGGGGGGGGGGFTGPIGGPVGPTTYGTSNMGTQPAQGPAPLGALPLPGDPGTAPVVAPPPPPPLPGPDPSQGGGGGGGFQEVLSTGPTLHPHLAQVAPSFAVNPGGSLQSLAANFGSLMHPSAIASAQGPQGIGPILAAHNAPPIAPPPAPPPHLATMTVRSSPSTLHSLASTFFGVAPTPSFSVHTSGVASAAQVCAHDPLVAADRVVRGAREGSEHARNYVLRTAQLAAHGSEEHVGAYRYLNRAAHLQDRGHWVRHYLYNTPPPAFARPHPASFGTIGRQQAPGTFGSVANAMAQWARLHRPAHAAGLGASIPGIPGYGTPYGDSFLYGMGELS
jgi:hypothetical protein